jgi:hypothetical protein
MFAISPSSCCLGNNVARAMHINKPSLLCGLGIGQPETTNSWPLYSQPIESSSIPLSKMPLSSNEFVLNEPRLLYPDDTEEPLFVNAKQYSRILKRREARTRLEQRMGRISFLRDSPASITSLGSSGTGEKPYMHESRHKHAMRRPRGPHGRFLTAKEMEEMKAREKDAPEKGEKEERKSKRRQEDNKSEKVKAGL